MRLGRGKLEKEEDEEEEGEEEEEEEEERKAVKCDIQNHLKQTGS